MVVVPPKAVARMRARGIARAPLRAACLPPPLTTNPYQRLLAHALEGVDVGIEGGWSLDARSLRRDRGRLHVLHLHWPESYYRERSAPRAVRAPISVLRLGVLGARLAYARVLGYRLVWTVHQVVPHEPETPRLDRLAARMLAVLAAALIVHDAGTADAVERLLGRRARGKVRVIPHGPYTGVYPARRARGEVRTSLGIPDDAVVLLAFGHVRGYKSLSTLLRAFEQVRSPRLALVVAGMAMLEADAAEIDAAAARDPRIHALLRYVPDDEVGDLFAATDVAVFARGDAGTSGSLVLALSQGVPVVAAEAGSAAELVGEAGWLYRPWDVDSLAAVLDRVVEDGADRRRRAERAREPAVTSWAAVAEATRDVYGARR